MSNPLADQMLAAISEAERLAPHNGHLVEDRFVGDVVQMAATGRLATSQLMVDGYPSPRVRLVSTGVLDDDPETAEDFSDQSDHSGCYRCYCTDPSPAMWVGSDDTTKRLWISAGSVIVEIYFCPECAADLESRYSNVVWKEN